MSVHAIPEDWNNKSIKWMCEETFRAATQHRHNNSDIKFIFCFFAKGASASYQNDKIRAWKKCPLHKFWNFIVFHEQGIVIERWSNKVQFIKKLHTLFQRWGLSADWLKRWERENHGHCLSCWPLDMHNIQKLAVYWCTYSYFWSNWSAKWA